MSREPGRRYFILSVTHGGEPRLHMRNERKFAESFFEVIKGRSIWALLVELERDGPQAWPKVRIIGANGEVPCG